jgi:16S rRNA (guanine966-N2)-methyltransferase
LRVVAGRLGGRRLGSPPAGVRPTSDRVREALFARLEPLEDLRVLDLFCGTGGLGIEAISRGASRVVFVDRARSSIQAVRENLASLGVEDGFEILRSDAGSSLRRLAKAEERFDLVLADPPYEAGGIAALLEALAASGLLESQAVVVVERAKRHVLGPVEGLELIDERRYGDTVIDRYVPQTAGGSEEAEADDQIGKPG